MIKGPVRVRKRPRPEHSRERCGGRISGVGDGPDATTTCKSRV